MKRLQRLIKRMKRTAFVFAPFMLAVPSTLWAQVEKGGLNVGTTYFHFTDESRKETFTEDTKFREVYAQAWYPADDVDGGVKAPYVKDANKSLGIIKTLFQLGDDSMKCFESLTTKAYLDVPISKANRKYPVLIFQHGYSFWLNQNASLMEFLASQGYIVLSIAHPFETCYAVGEDGTRTYSLTNPGLTARWSEILNEEISKHYASIMDNPYSAETMTTERKVLTMQPKMQESVMIWAQDASFVLDQLESLKKSGDSPLSKSMDLKRVGAFGMSFGGAATAQFMTIDKRVKAGLNMDGAMFGDLIDRPLNRPFMFMIAGNHGNLNELHYRQAKAEAIRLIIADSKHLDFCDLNLIDPEYFQKAGLMGEIDKSRMNKILRRYTLAFFDQYLKSSKKWLPDGKLYPEVTVQERNIK